MASGTALGRVLALVLAAAVVGQGADADEKTCETTLPEDDQSAMLHVATKVHLGQENAPQNIVGIDAIGALLKSFETQGQGAAPGPEVKAPAQTDRGFPGMPGNPPFGGGGFPPFMQPQPTTVEEHLHKICPGVDSPFVRAQIMAGFHEVFKVTNPSDAFTAKVGSLGMPLSLGLVNDFPFQMSVNNYTVLSGHEFSGPASGEIIQPGQAAVWHAYRTGGSQIEITARILVHDASWHGQGTDLVLAAARYRMSNYLTGCEKMRGKIGWGSDTNLVYKNMCHMDSGMTKDTDYEFAVMTAAALCKVPHPSMGAAPSA
mmetsp:Transcript_61184/g.157799  ORF Transcript_61184/g.157799 Transcript_61184/m.157799 type:complete len:316 (-) Transcript_61184:104-1051(-)